MRFSWANQEWQANADRTLLQIEPRTLFVADVHLGKGTSLRSFGAPVPTGSTDVTLQRLQEAVQFHRAEHLIILGDLIHDQRAKSDAVVESARRFFQNLQIPITWVEGNHDRKARSGKPIGITPVPEPYPYGPLILRHEPLPDPEVPALAGHLHPGVTLYGRGRQSIRLSCFWIQPNQIVLPAFGELTGTARVPFGEGDRVIAIAEDRCIELPTQAFLAIS